jgi:hypothetical protein
LRAINHWFEQPVPETLSPTRTKSIFGRIKAPIAPKIELVRVVSQEAIPQFEPAVPTVTLTG